MPNFEYTARTANGTVTHGTLIAQDEHDLAQKLSAQQLTLTVSSVGRHRTGTASFLDRLQGVPMVERMFFTQYLHVLIRAGFSISRALDTLSQQTTHRYFKKILREVRSDVESGMSFSKTLGKYPRVFSELYVNMIAAGEASGKLDEVLDRLALKMKKDHELLGKIKGALTYPIIIVVAMIGIAIFITVFVIPKLTEVFRDTNAKLPLPTRVLMGISDFILHHGLIVVGIVVVLAVISLQFIRTRRGKRAFDVTVLRLPIFGAIIKKINLARFTRSLSSLLETNIPIIETFFIISRTMSNVPYRAALEEAGQELRGGSTITKLLEHYPKLFPPITTQMIAVGEESGTLDTIAGELATFYEEDVDQTMSNLSTIIEPVLMLVLGVGVALIAVAVILPIYSLTQQFG